MSNNISITSKGTSNWHVPFNSNTIQLQWVSYYKSYLNTQSMPKIQEVALGLSNPYHAGLDCHRIQEVTPRYHVTCGMLVLEG